MDSCHHRFEINFFGPSKTSDGIGRAASLNLQCLNMTGYTVNEFVLSRPVALQKNSSVVITDELKKATATTMLEALYYKMKEAA